MIGGTGTLRRIQIINDPVTPVFTAPATMTSTNTAAGSGSFTFQFNATKLTCTTNTTGSVSGTGASSFQYFNSTSVIDPSDYEVQLTLGTNGGNSNIALGAGSASLGVWINLATSPLFNFSCSDRRGGSRPVNITIRHKTNTAVSANTSITLNQTSNAVAPTFSGLSGTTTLTRTTANSYLGIYIDSESSANAGRIRTYKESTIDTNVGFTFSTGSIPESEYEFQFLQTSVTPSGAMSIGGVSIGVYIDVSAARVTSPSRDSGGRFLALNTSVAGTGVMRITMRHKLDQAKSAFFDKSFQTT